MLNNKILVIDDEETIIETIRQVLKGRCYEIISATNGKDGLVEYEKEQPILVILDLMMPVMNGVEFLENLKIRYHDICSVMVLTGRGDEEEKKCFDLGAFSFIKKPFDINVFRGTVMNTIKAGQLQQELVDEIKSCQ